MKIRMHLLAVAKPEFEGRIAIAGSREPRWESGDRAKSSAKPDIQDSL